MTTNAPKPRRHAWLVTLLTFASLVFALLAFMTPFNLIFGPLAIVSGAAGLILNRLVWGGHRGQS
jgi:hypothetical protein